LKAPRNQKTPHLGGAIKVGDPYTYCPAAWDYVISRFCIRSILDLGSGSGNVSYYFHKAGMQVVALEGLPANRRTGAIGGYSTSSGPGCSVRLHTVGAHRSKVEIGITIYLAGSGKWKLLKNGDEGREN
jgi:hypothetical protein